MQNKIAMFGTTVESLTDQELEIDVSPNRPDLLSYQGFKRSFLAFLGKKTGLKNYKINKPEKNFVVHVDKSVKEIRPYTACAIVKNLKFNDEKIKEIIETQEKLHNTVGRKRKKLAIGIYPLEKITLPITFKALEPDKIKFQPLESPREMSGLQILQRHPTGRDYAHLLAGKSKFPIFIDAKNDVLSMPPIINSHKTGKISKNTKEVFIECSGFDFEILKQSLNIITTILADMGGEIYQMQLKGNVKTITPDFTTEKMKLSISNAEKLLGLKLTEKEIKKYLEKMGHNYENGTVEIASWRTDILHEVDLIEDIAIAYGYENFEAEIPEIATIGKEDPKETIKRKISDILTGLEFLETSSNHLTKKQNQFTKMGISEKNHKDFIEVEESKTDNTILRKNLTHYLMKILGENIDSEYPQKIFETGRVFNLQDEKIIESEKLAIAITPGNFTELKQVLEYFGKMLDIKFQTKECEEAPKHFIDGRCAEIFIEEKVAKGRELISENAEGVEGGRSISQEKKNNNGERGRELESGIRATEQNKKSIGYLGEIHPKILRNWKIKMPVALLEIELGEIFERLI